MENLEGQKILNEILSAHYEELAERIDRHPSAVDHKGRCGETPLLISVYKMDVLMLRMLLQAGAFPDIRNGAGETAMHVAARLGATEHVKLIYATGKCNLELKDRHGLSCLDIAAKPVELEDIAVTKLFGVWDRAAADDAAMLQIISRGRKECADFLRDKARFDRDAKNERIVSEVLAYNARRNNASRIIRGIGSTKKQSSIYFNERLTFPESKELNDNPWPSEDRAEFLREEEWVERAVRSVYVCDYIDRSVKSGFHRAMIRLKR